MKRLDHRGPHDGRSDDIIDAEFTEVPRGLGAASNDGQTIGQWLRSVCLYGLKVVGIVVSLGIIATLAIAMLAPLFETDQANAIDHEPLDVNATEPSPDFVAYIYNDPTSAGGIAMIDELPDSAAPVCDGKLIWTFNGNDDTFTLTGPDTSSSGRYAFDGARLKLTNVEEQDADGNAIGAARSFTHEVSRGAGGRVVIGSRSYRQCAATGAGGNDRQSQAERERAASSTPAQAATSEVPALTCHAIEQTAAQIISGRTGRKIIEINISSETVEDGQLSCRGTAMTDTGGGTISFGTSTTPQGRRLVVAYFIPVSF
ncbi:hypothetical protein LRS12_08320 [Sphingomonas sp. J344]|uniref:hypothetical protein n=1 Tax=Sphingomonas sp. J344 TaxID=2898434 RepID=UPI002151B9F4|nr:hypothetical protein [Sphingomonas sp. J344]MCR5870711.1 hypothetical protein [Sphingomonas sp. J344]